MQYANGVGTCLEQQLGQRVEQHSGQDEKQMEQGNAGHTRSNKEMYKRCYKSSNC